MTQRQIDPFLPAAFARGLLAETRATRDEPAPEGFTLRTLDPATDAALLHSWFVQDYARFWAMQDYTVTQVRDFYQSLVDSGHACAGLAYCDGHPAFLVEIYDPAHDELGEHYPVRAGDLGMHIFVGPPRVRISGYTRRAITFVMRFLFDRLHAPRVVVEPDIHNTPIHALNRAVGFVYDGQAQLRGKTAGIAFCTRDDFATATLQEHTA